MSCRLAVLVPALLFACTPPREPGCAKVLEATCIGKRGAEVCRVHLASGSRETIADLAMAGDLVCCAEHVVFGRTEIRCRLAGERP